MLPIKKIKEIDTEVTFQGKINWEKYLDDTTTVGAVAQLFDDLKPTLNIWLFLPLYPTESKVDQHKELRNYIEESLGYENVKGKLRIWIRRDNAYRLWCKDYITFLQILDLFKGKV